MNLGKKIVKTDISDKLMTLTAVMDNSCDYQVHIIINYPSAKDQWVL
jgi:hypothetical protein